jgi:hypothetical protein
MNRIESYEGENEDLNNLDLYVTLNLVIVATSPQHVVSKFMQCVHAVYSLLSAQENPPNLLTILEDGDNAAG